jgi:hypothetical protein
MMKMTRSLLSFLTARVSALLLLTVVVSAAPAHASEVVVALEQESDGYWKLAESAGSCAGPVQERWAGGVTVRLESHDQVRDADRCHVDNPRRRRG